MRRYTEDLDSLTRRQVQTWNSGEMKYYVCSSCQFFVCLVFCCHFCDPRKPYSARSQSWTLFSLLNIINSTTTTTSRSSGNGILTDFQTISIFTSYRKEMRFGYLSSEQQLEEIEHTKLPFAAERVWRSAHAWCFSEECQKKTFIQISMEGTSGDLEISISLFKNLYTNERIIRSIAP